jgi:hypothetical protein
MRRTWGRAVVAVIAGVAVGLFLYVSMLEPWVS